MLEPNQIGILASLVRESLANFPPPEISMYRKMEDWEKDLITKCDAHSGLPRYNELEEKHLDVLEFLIEYYS